MKTKRVIQKMSCILLCILTITSCKSQITNGCYINRGKESHRYLSIKNDSIIWKESMYMSNGYFTYKGLNKDKNKKLLYLEGFDRNRDSARYQDSIYAANLVNHISDSSKFEFVFFDKSAEWPMNKLKVKLLKNGKEISEFETNKNGQILFSLASDNNAKYEISYGRYVNRKTKLDISQYNNKSVYVYLAISREADQYYMKPEKTIIINVKDNGKKLIVDGLEFIKTNCEE